jgi:hypothetical protein
VGTVGRTLLVRPILVSRGSMLTKDYPRLSLRTLAQCRHRSSRHQRHSPPRPAPSRPPSHLLPLLVPHRGAHAYWKGICIAAGCKGCRGVAVPPVPRVSPIRRFLCSAAPVADPGSSIGPKYAVKYAEAGARTLEDLENPDLLKLSRAQTIGLRHVKVRPSPPLLLVDCR